MNEEQLKYPIGRVKYPDALSDFDLESAIEDINILPEKLMDITLGLNPEDLLHTYRPEGWNIKQVVHHLADSHMNAFIRFKTVITEGDGATIKPYEESKWAETNEIDDAIEDSLLILRGIHNRWAKLISNTPNKVLEQSYYHPETKSKFSLFKATALYQWHGKHHLGHIKNALIKME